MAAAARLDAIAGHFPLLQSAASFSALAAVPTAGDVREIQRSVGEAVGEGAPLYSQDTYLNITKEVDAFNAKFGTVPWERSRESMTLWVSC